MLDLGWLESFKILSRGLLECPRGLLECPESLYGFCTDFVWIDSDCQFPGKSAELKTSKSSMSTREDTVLHRGQNTAIETQSQLNSPL